MNYGGDEECGGGCTAAPPLLHTVPAVPSPQWIYPPNAFGLFHVHGNVAEFCVDAYQADFYSTIVASGANPVSSGPENAQRVARGGTFAHGSGVTRSASRVFRTTPDSRLEVLGLRPVKRVPTP